MDLGKSISEPADALLSGLLRALMLTAGTALALLMLVQVLGRYVLRTPFIGVEELLSLAAIWLYFLGAAYATRNGSHVGGGVVEDFVRSPLVAAAIKVLADAISLLVVCIYAILAVRYTIDTVELGRLTSFLRWPRWLWTGAMVSGFACCTVYVLRDLVRSVSRLGTLRAGCAPAARTEA